MNERIKELQEQAESFAEPALVESYGGMQAYFDIVIAKFAELIVQECENSIKLVPTHFEAQDKIIVECLKAIRETFRS